MKYSINKITEDINDNSQTFLQLYNFIGSLSLEDMTEPLKIEINIESI